MRDATASPNLEPEKRPGKTGPHLPVDSEADAILQFESEPGETDDANTLPSETAEPARVTPFPTVVHAKAPACRRACC